MTDLTPDGVRERLAESAERLAMAAHDGRVRYARAGNLADAILDAARVVAREEVTAWLKAAEVKGRHPSADPASVESAPAPSFPSEAGLRDAKLRAAEIGLREYESGYWNLPALEPIGEIVDAYLAVDRPAIEEAGAAALRRWLWHEGIVRITDEAFARFLAERKEGK